MTRRKHKRRVHRTVRKNKNNKDVDKADKADNVDENKVDIENPKKFKNGLFIFRRDLRIQDNNGLNSLAMICENVYTAFIFTPEQVSNGNEYKSVSSVRFMIESLNSLAREISKKGGKLHLFYGRNQSVLNSILSSKANIEVVGVNRDVTPFSISRDKALQKVCFSRGVMFAEYDDLFLHPIGSIKNGSGEAYQKFTPYYENARREKVEKPITNSGIKYANGILSNNNQISLNTATSKFVGNAQMPNVYVHGGREEAIKRLRNVVRTQARYKSTRNDLGGQTSRLSAYLKFGCVSAREVYYAFKNNNEFIRQLYWRDFYANIMYHFPRVLGKSLKPKYDKIHWKHNERWFRAWCEGKTGFPIVDAGMRELNATGYMHNRARMIVASFLVKLMWIDWRKGEKYFATHLVDYDPANNNGGWQWVTSNGADSQPYYRIFNPWRQTEEYDSKGEYVKKWVEELRDVPVKDILKWDDERIRDKHKDIKYPEPILNYEKQREYALKSYSKIV